MGFDSEPNVWKSIAAGAIGGLVASLAMNQFQAAVSAISQSAAQIEANREHVPPEQSQQSSGDDATVKAAQAISTELFDHSLSKEEKQWAGPTVHYSLGVTLGAIYGGLASFEPVAAGAGTAFGAAVWLIADEVSVPLLGLAPPPQESPISSHINSLASHLVFGLVTHLTSKLVLS